MNEFDIFITAHISKTIQEKKLDEIAENKQMLINGVMNILLCECYPLVVKYVDTLFEES